MTVSSLKAKVQAFLNDRKAENRILGNTEEYNLEDVINCSNLALEEINHKGIIITSYTMDSCDPYLLTLGTAKYLLSAEISLKTRNYVTINDGGTSVNREGNIDLYYRIYQIIADEFRDQIEAKKGWLNLKNGYGH